MHRVTQNFYDGVYPRPVSFRANLLYADFFISSTGPGRPILEENNTLDAAGMAALYVDPDAADFTLRAPGSLPRVARNARAPHDFCGHARGPMTELGPIDYSHPAADECVARIRAIYDAL